MSTKTGRDGPAPKRVRLAETSDAKSTAVRKPAETKTFDGVPAIQATLAANGGQPSTILVETLTALRNQLSLRHAEVQTLIDNAQKTATTSTKGSTSGSYLNSLPTVLQPNDPRLLLLETWCSSSPGLEELFAVWDSAAASVPSGWSKSAQGPAAMANTISSLVLNVLTSILSLLSAYYTFQPHGAPVLKNLFDNDRWRRVCNYATSTGGGSSNDLILVTLRLLAVVVEKWDGKKVLDGFVWESKSLVKLLQMRRKGQSTHTSNPLIKPDIRTAYALFLLAFLLPSSSAGPSTNSQTKAAFLQQYSLHYTSIFKNLHSDSPSVVRRVLEVSWEGVWCDVRVSRSLKVGVFAGPVLSNLLKLYERTSEEEDGFSVADLVHHFLLAICTRPGVGLCFKDRGWYPRDVGGDTLFNDEENNDGDDNAKSKPKIYNPTLLTLLKQLKPTDDPRQNELALKILHVAPELVSMYLPQNGLTLDPPRLSSKWIANLCLFVSVVGANGSVDDIVKEGGFRMDSESADAGGRVVYRPTPPPLSTIVNNVAPGGGATRLNMRNVFTKGLQFVPAPPGATGKGDTTSVAAANGNLVQHTTALGLIRCLNKLRRVREAMEGVSKALGEGEDVFVEGQVADGDHATPMAGPKEGLWTKRTREVVKEVRRRLPEFQVVLAFCTAHLKTATPAAVSEKEDATEGDQVRKELMAECAMRLLWMYQEALPEVVEEARFDVGKVLVGFDVSKLRESETEDPAEAKDEDKEVGDEDTNEGEGSEEGGEDEGTDEEGKQGPDAAPTEPSTQTRLRRLIQLHILRFLRVSPSFSFLAPSPNHPRHTHLYSLLLGFVKLGMVRDEISEELKRLVCRVLGKSIVFNWTGETRDAGNAGVGEVEAWLESLPVGLRRVRTVKRLVDVNEGEDDEGAAEGEGKMVTVYPETLDGTPLTDERLSVVEFLEDCILRCSKTPYKYIDELEKMAGVSASSATDNASADQPRLPSPLLVTMVEQLEAKLASQASGVAALLTPSDMLAIATYLRSLVFTLSGKVDTGFSSTTASRNPYLTVLNSVLDRCDALVLPGGDAWSKAFGGEAHALVKDAVRRELDIARRCLGLTHDASMPAVSEAQEEDRDVDDFLDLVEALEIPSSIERRLTMYELIDWVRLLGVSLDQGQTNRLWGAVEEVWPEGLGQVVRYLDVPDVHDGSKEGVSVWEVLIKKDEGQEESSKMDVDQDEDEKMQGSEDGDGSGAESEHEDAEEYDPSSLPFEYLLVHALPRHLLNTDCQGILVECALKYCKAYNDSASTSTSVTAGPIALLSYKVEYITRHILRRFSVFLAIKQIDVAKGLLSVLAGLLKEIKAHDGTAFNATKPVIVAGLKEFMELSTSSPGSLDAEAVRGVREGMLRVQDVALDPRVPADRALVLEIASSWVEALKTLLRKPDGDAEYASHWIRFVQPVEVLGLLEEFLERPQLLLDDGGTASNANRALELSLRTLKEASKARVERAQQNEFRAQLSSHPRTLDLLFRAYSVLSTLRASAQEKGDEAREAVIAGGVRTVEELIGAMQESEGVPAGLGGEIILTSNGEASLSQLVEAAEGRWATGQRTAESKPVDPATITSFLSQPLEEWTNATEKVVKNFIYCPSSDRRAVAEAVVQWMLSEDGGLRVEQVEGGEKVVGVVHALLDCAVHGEGESGGLLGREERATTIFDLLLHHLLIGSARKGQAKEGLEYLVQAAQEIGRVHALLSLFDKRLKPLRKSVDVSASPDVLTADLVDFVGWLTTIHTEDKKARERVGLIAGDVVEVGMQWLVRRLGDEEGQKKLEEDTQAVCSEIVKLIKKGTAACKAATLETLMGVVVQSQYHIMQPCCLEVIEIGLEKAGLKPLIVNKYLQAVIQHPHFFRLTDPSASTTPALAPLTKIRDSIISVLHTLFYLHPSNTCQVSHIEPLIRVYGGTLSVSDRKVLSIFRLFERQRKLSVRAIVGRWAPPSSSMAGAAASSTSIGLEALQNLDSVLVLRTGLAFPTWRGVDDDMEPENKKARISPSGFELQLYDPVFLLLLLQHVLANDPPASAISWIELFRSNVVGLALRALSAREGRVRELGMGCIVGLWALMQNADLQERDYVLHLLGLLKNAIPAPPARSTTSRIKMDGAEADDENEAWYAPRLPSYSTLLLFHALRGIFNPSAFIYPLTARFLLQRPELDITDVPMLYSMLYSSDTDDWKKERGWIVRFLADGVLTGSAVADWKLLKRRHVWDLVASMYQGSSASASSFAFSMSEGGAQATGATGDKALKHGVLEFFVNVTRHRGPTMGLVLKSGLLAWIEMQLTGSDRHAGNGIEWLRILENVMVSVDVGKMESGAMKGQWTRSIARCVELILEEAIASPSSLADIFTLAVRAVVRLSTFSSVGSETMASLLVQCLKALKLFESNVKKVPSTSAAVPRLDDLVPPPRHSSHGLHERLVFDDQALLFIWGRSVESLWQATMKGVDVASSNEDSDRAAAVAEVWNQLTARLLVWRSLVGAEASPTGEWARVECVANLG